MLAYRQSSSTYLLRERKLLDAVSLATQKSTPSKRDSPASGYVEQSQIIFGLSTTKFITDERTWVAWRSEDELHGLMFPHCVLHNKYRQ